MIHSLVNEEGIHLAHGNIITTIYLSSIPGSVIALFPVFRDVCPGENHWLCLHGDISRSMSTQELYMMTGVALTCSGTLRELKRSKSLFMLRILLFQYNKKGILFISSTAITHVYFSRVPRSIMFIFTVFLSFGKNTIYENVPQNGSPQNMSLLSKLPTNLWPIMYLH